MHITLMLLLAFQSATVIDVQVGENITLALAFGDTIYTAEFPRSVFGREDFREGDRVQTQVKDGRMTVLRKDGRRVSGRVIRVLRTLVHPRGALPNKSFLPIKA